MWPAPNAASRTGAILDSQSVKSDGHGGAVGYDAAKQIKGRKRHLVVDKVGLILGVTVTPAGTWIPSMGVPLLNPTESLPTFLFSKRR